ncbi:2-hydroxyacyl-CoA dehydratase subunit D [Desulfatibacillum aliphaticivorans]|uniref:2-hydroxyacyl-CoA dehydratase subunit D n=1 Tax=Desulfatibacillum aliphaticivorans TaxID=218208 RepID=UPI0004003317|nr:2-hydroxyacyl-CoA dehydratase family protein [Desulfatibacillum aliphaticivorans]
MAQFVKTDSGKRLTRLITNGYMDNIVKAQQGAFVVWIAIIVPAEIFAGFDNVIYCVPESHSALCAGKGVGVSLCEKAENLGYSMDLCSYARIDMGCHFNQGADSPAGGLPKPDLLVSNNNNCTLLAKWFDVYHREWDIPHFILDIPFCYESQKQRDMEYIVSQFQDLIQTVEKLSGQKFNPEKMAQAWENSVEANKHWRRFLAAAKNKPSGITAFDSFVQMAPTLTMRGTPELAEHYRFLADETEARVDQGIVPAPNEKYRLLWDNIAPWHQLRKMSSRLGALDANIISASYTYCLGSREGSLDLLDLESLSPLEGMARLQNFSICPHGLQLRGRAMKQAIEEMDIDGVVFASNRSCKVYSLMQMDQQRYVQEELGVPTVMIDVDHADERKYSEETAFVRMEALLESIDEARR